MECPKCKGKMVKGILTETGWKKQTSIFSDPKTGKRIWENEDFKVQVAHRCSKCGYIEIYAKQYDLKTIDKF